MALHTDIITAPMDPWVPEQPIDLNETVKLEIISKGGAGQNSSGSNGGQGGGGGGYAVWNALAITDPSQCAIVNSSGVTAFAREDTESYNVFDGQAGASGGVGGYHDESVEAPDIDFAGGNGGTGQAFGGGGGGGEAGSAAERGNDGTGGAGGGAGGTGTDGADGGQGGELFGTNTGSAGTSPGGGGGGGANNDVGGAGGGFEVRLTYTVFVDVTAPDVEITDPVDTATYETSDEEIDLVARVTDAVGVTAVTVENDRTEDDPVALPNISGDDYGETIGLFDGVNVLTVRGTDAEDNEGVDTLTVTLTSAEMRSGDGVDIEIDDSDTGHITKLVASADLPENYALTANTGNSNLTKLTTSISPTFFRIPLASIPPISTIIEIVLRYSIVSAPAPGTGYVVKIAGNPTHTGRDIYLAILAGAAASTTQTLTTGQKTITLNATAVASLQAAVAAGHTYWYLGLEALTSTSLATISDIVELGISLDATVPLLAITTPDASQPMFTDEATVDLAGTVSDNYDIDTVVWRSSRGGGDEIAVVDGDWEVEDIPLVFGLNIISIIATDINGLVQTKKLFVNRTPNGSLYPCTWGTGSRRRRR